MSILEEREFRFLNSFQLVSQIAELDVGHTLSFEDFILQIFIFLLKKLNGILIIVLNFEILGKDLLDLRIFRVYDLFKLSVLVVESFNLVEVLLFEVFNLRVEIVLKFGLQGVNLFLVLGFLIKKISSKPFLFFFELANLKISFFIESNKLHIEVTNLIFFFLTVFLQFSDLQFIFLVVAEVDSLDVLDLHMVLVLELTDLHVLHMLNFIDFLL